MGRRSELNAVDRIVLHIVDVHRVAVVPNFVADRHFELEFTTGLEAQLNAVLNAARDPAVLLEPGDCSEPHARRAALDVEDGGDGRYPANGFDVALAVRH